MIHEDIKKLLGVPDYYVDEYNSTPMHNFWCVIEHLLQVFRPTHICEIGSERGLTSKHLIQYCFSTGTRLSIVDPAPQPWLPANHSDIGVFPETSLEFLKRGLPVDFYLIDGDHNFYTVKAELEALAANRQAGSKMCVVLHDVSWPAGEREMYYFPQTIPEPRPYVFGKSVHLENHELVDAGFPSGQVFAWGTEYGAAEVGVLPAVKAFLADHPTGWRFVKTPILYGYGFLWHEDGLDAEQSEEIAQILAPLEALQPLLAITEANRLRLLQGLDEHRQLAERRQTELDEVRNQTLLHEGELRRRQLDIVSLEAEVARLRGTLAQVAEERDALRDEDAHLRAVGERMRDELHRANNQIEYWEAKSGELRRQVSSLPIRLQLEAARQLKQRMTGVIARIKNGRRPG